jgi:ribosomal peptide maturation radical SAM protein 1
MRRLDVSTAARPDYLDAYASATTPCREITQVEWLEFEGKCGKALAETSALVARLSPRIVALSNNYGDNLAVIAFARSIRQALPDAVIVLGGSACAGEVGEEMLRGGGVFDYVFRGEADIAFADFCEQYLSSGVLPPERLIDCGIVREMDTVPVPDYSDYFETQKKLGYPPAAIPFESSRGCHWGARKPCTFCSDASSDFSFRYKSPERMLEELVQLRRDYPDSQLFFATDLMIPPAYFDGFFQELVTQGLELNLVYQIKPNLKKQQLTILRKAGFYYCFAGIESLSTHILIRLNKGASAAANLMLLRNGRETGLTIVWNIIMGIPGDHLSDYEEQLTLMPALHHLSPPHQMPLLLMRFSAYTRYPEQFGIRNLRPLPAYTRIYPPHMNSNRLAQYYEGEFASESRENPEILKRVTEAIIRWHELWQRGEPPLLRMVRQADGISLVEDTRPCARERQVPLDDKQYDLICRCRVPLKKDHLPPGPAVDMLLERRFLVETDGKLLSVVCDEEGE